MKTFLTVALIVVIVAGFAAGYTYSTYCGKWAHFVC